jgi:transposase-like protein
LPSDRDGAPSATPPLADPPGAVAMVQPAGVRALDPARDSRQYENHTRSEAEYLGAAARVFEVKRKAKPGQFRRWRHALKHDAGAASQGCGSNTVTPPRP